MSSKKLVTPVTAFQSVDGFLYEDYETAAISSAGSVLYDAAEEYNAQAGVDHVDVDFEALARFLRANRPLVRKILGL
jgi:hypothetical protein